MLIKMTITQHEMGLLEKIFHLHNPYNPLYQEQFTILYIPKGPDM